MNYNFNMSKIYMNKLEAKIKELEARIDKAIEYIERTCNTKTKWISYPLVDFFNIDELLKILKGENDDNNSSSN